MQYHVSTPALTLLCLLYAAIAGSIIRLALVRQAKVPGWTSLTAGPSHWFCLVGSVGAVAFMSWIWLFVGSSRYDAEDQMKIAYFMIFAAGAAAIFVARHMTSLRRQNLRWRGRLIAFEDKQGVTHEVRADEAETFETRFSGYIHILLKGGTTIVMDPHCKHSDTFFSNIVEKSGWVRAA